MAPFRIARPRFLLYFAAELGLILAVVAALSRLTSSLVPLDVVPSTWPTVAVIGALFAVGLSSMSWVSLGDDDSLKRELVIFTVISFVLALIAFAAIWVLIAEDDRRFPALLALEAGIGVPMAIAAWRWLALRVPLFDALRERVLILGTGETARQVCRWIADGHGREYGIVGFAAENDERLGTVLAMGARIQTGYDRLTRFCPARVDRVIVALDEKRGKLPVRQLMELRLQGVEIEDATSFFERISGKIAVETMLPSWLIFSEGFKTTRMRLWIKRIADVALSVVLLVLTTPLMLLTAIAVKLDSRGPLLYRQDRLGREGQEFELLKFRSMRHEAESKSGPTWTVKNDPRITRVGQMIRKLRIDELPQLINVLRGEMSFVGPRPERGHFVRQLEKTIPYYGLRMTVRPGITGWSQVQYGYGANEEDAQEKLKYDLFYIKNSNLLLDLWIVLKTVKVVLIGKGAR